MNKITVKSMGVALLCSHLLKVVCENVKNESGIYHQKTKKMLNNLLETVDSTLAKTHSLKAIQNTSKFLNRELEGEVVEDEVVTNAEIVEFVTDILLEGNGTKIYDLHLLLKNVKDGKRVYTQEEHEHFNSNPILSTASTLSS